MSFEVPGIFFQMSSDKVDKIIIIYYKVEICMDLRLEGIALACFDGQMRKRNL